MKALIFLALMFSLFTGEQARPVADSLRELKNKCLNNDYESCLKVSKELRRQCAVPAIANDFQRNLECMGVADCWMNLANNYHQLVESEILYGEHSDHYEGTLRALSNIVRYTDTCKTFSRQF